MRRILPSEVPNQGIRCVAELNFDYVRGCIAWPHGDVGECTRRAEILFTVNLDGLRAELIPFRVLEPAEIAAEFLQHQLQLGGIRRGFSTIVHFGDHPTAGIKS